MHPAPVGLQFDPNFLEASHSDQEPRDAVFVLREYIRAQGVEIIHSLWAGNNDQDPYANQRIGKLLDIIYADNHKLTVHEKERARSAFHIAVTRQTGHLLIAKAQKPV